MKNPTPLNKTVWAALLIVYLTIGIGKATARDLTDNLGQLTLSYMPLSYHWDRGHNYNENHNGIGISLGLGHGFTVSAMRYRNSFNDMTTMAALDKHIGCLKQICFGYGAGYAWGYKNNMMIPMAAWGSVRWKMIRIGIIPGVVTTLSFVIPLN